MSAPAPPAALGNTPGKPSLPADRRQDEFHDYPRDQWDHPLIALLDNDGKPIPNPMTGQTDRYGTPIPWKCSYYHRASSAGSAIEYEGAINSWRIRQTVIGLVARADLFALAQGVHEPGGAGRSEMDKIVDKAQEAAGSSTSANEGTAGHAFAEKVDRGQVVPPLEDPFRSWLAAYQAVTKGWRWHAIEERLVCDELGMAGRTDRLGSPPGYMIAPDGTIIGPEDVLAVDIKTSSSSKYFGVKFAVQLAVYAHGKRYDPRTGLRTALGTRTDWALVVHVPTGGTSGALYWVNVATGYELGLLAKSVLKQRSRKDLVLPVVAQRGDGRTVYASLEEALAAGGRLATADEVAQVQQPEPSALEVATGQAAAVEAVRRHLTSTVPESVTAGIRPDLGPSLQRGRELEMVRTAPPRGGLEAVRQRLADRWSDELEAAAQLREWQLAVLVRLDAAPDLDALVAIWSEVNGYGAWTPEMDTAATQVRTRLGRAE